MAIHLPPRTDGLPSPTIGPARQTVIIGANGAGKTRFAQQLAADIVGSESNRPVYNMSGTPCYLRQPTHSRLHRLDLRCRPRVVVARQCLNPKLERLIALLVHDEMVNLFRFLKRLMPPDWEPASEPTRLDRLMELWRRYFPTTEYLSRADRCCFSRPADDGAHIRPLKLPRRVRRR